MAPATASLTSPRLADQGGDASHRRPLPLPPPRRGQTRTGKAAGGARLNGDCRHDAGLHARRSGRPAAARHGRALALDLGLEGAASRAVVQVSAQEVRLREPPERVESCSRISKQGVSRASRRAPNDERAWNTSAFTFSLGQPTTSAISSCESAPSSAMNERGALVVGKAAEVAEQVAQVLPALHRRGEAVD
jgi:hypothetical protein